MPGQKLLPSSLDEIFSFIIHPFVYRPFHHNNSARWMAITSAVTTSSQVRLTSHTTWASHIILTSECPPPELAAGDLYSPSTPCTIAPYFLPLQSPVHRLRNNGSRSGHGNNGCPHCKLSHQHKHSPCSPITHDLPTGTPKRCDDKYTWTSPVVLHHGILECSPTYPSRNPGSNLRCAARSVPPRTVPNGRVRVRLPGMAKVLRGETLCEHLFNRAAGDRHRTLRH